MRYTLSARMGRVAAVFVLLSTAFALKAAPPTLTNLTPRGAERGKTVEIVVSGANLTPQTRLLLPFKATQAVVPDTKPNPAQVRFQITVDASVPLGGEVGFFRFPAPKVQQVVIETLSAPKVTAAMTNLTLTCTTTIGGMAYNHPPVTIASQLK